MGASLDGHCIHYILYHLSFMLEVIYHLSFIIHIDIGKCLGAWVGASLDGHWTLSSKQKPCQGPRPLPGITRLISVNVASCMYWSVFLAALAALYLTLVSG